MINRQEHLANKEIQKQKKLAAGLISERFPEVSSIVIHMTYHQKLSNHVLMVRTVNFSPISHAYFNLECLTKKCINGGFELTRVIANMIKKHKKSDNGKTVCRGKNDSLASGHARISYEISIKYNKKSK
jgi:hypothetical protein